MPTTPPFTSFPIPTIPLSSVVISGTINPMTFGAFADGNSHPITQTDINNNPQWLGPYQKYTGPGHTATWPVGTEWDTVAMQEAIYAAFAYFASDPLPIGQIVWNSQGPFPNYRLFVPAGFYQINWQLVMRANGFYIDFSDRDTTQLQWKGYNKLSGTVSNCFVGNTHTSTTVDGISASDIAQLFVGMSVLDATIQQTFGSIPLNTTITAINVGAGSITLSNATTSTVTGLQIYVTSSCLLMDGCAYGHLNNLALDGVGMSQAIRPANLPTGQTLNPLLQIDKIISGGLSTQQLTFLNLLIFGNGVADVGMSLNPVSTSSGQGDTLMFLNPFISGCNNSGFEINGNNALHIMIMGGDFQGCHYKGISAYGGYAHVYGTGCQNQLGNFFTAPQRHQYALDGYDYYMNHVGGDNVPRISDIRSEAGKGVYLVNGGTVSNYLLSDGDKTTQSWFASNNYVLGDMIYPTINNTKNRRFICVDAGPSNTWQVTSPTGSGSSGDTIQVTPNPGWVVNSLVGKFLRFRFGSNGFTSNPGAITSNTANTVTITGSGLGNQCNTATMIFIQNLSGGSQPNWDSAADSSYIQEGQTSQGFYTTSGSAVIQNASPPGLTVGQYVVIPDANSVGVFNSTLPQFIFPLIASVASTTGIGIGQTATLSLPANYQVGLGVPGGGGNQGARGYWGTAITDGSIHWMELPSSTFEGVSTLAQCAGSIARNCRDIVSTDLSVGTKTGVGLGLYPISTSIVMAPGNALGFINVSTGPTLKNSFVTLATTTPLDLTTYVTAGDILYLTPTQSQTLNAPTPNTNVTQEIELIILTSGGTSFTITFGTNFVSAGTLATGTTTGKYYIVKFVSHAATQKWIEISRIGPL